MGQRVEAKINKETLSMICARAGVTASFLSQKTRLSEERINAWMDVSNGSYPTILQAKKLAKALKIPFAGLYMCKTAIPIKQLPRMRNLRTIPHPDLDDSTLNLAVVELIRYHEFLDSVMGELEIFTAFPRLPTISHSADEMDYATFIRDYFELDLSVQFRFNSTRKFYLHVRQQIEGKGVFIHCFSGVDVEIARGITIFNDGAPIIGINNNDRYPAKTFSIIHELVHVLKRQSAICNDMFSVNAPLGEEAFCNAVAGQVLVPSHSLRVVLEERKLSSFDLNIITDLGKKYSVSKEVVVRRLYDMGLISRGEYNAFVDEIQNRFLLEQESNRIARLEGKGRPYFTNVTRGAIDKNSSAICKILLAGYGDGYFSYQDVSGILGIKEKHIPKFLSEVARW